MAARGEKEAADAAAPAEGPGKDASAKDASAKDEAPAADVKAARAAAIAAEKAALAKKIAEIEAAKKGKAPRRKADEPEPMDVLVDVVLSVEASPSPLLRQLVDNGGWYDWGEKGTPWKQIEDVVVAGAMAPPYSPHSFTLAHRHSAGTCTGVKCCGFTSRAALA